MTDLELLKDRIEETTWYHIHNGELVEGANGEDDEPLYKAKDILGILEEFVPEEDKPFDFRDEQEFNDRWGKE